MHTCIGPDPPKTTAFVCHAATKAKDEAYMHYLGQKGLPMFASLDNFDYQRFNLPEWMHNLSRSAMCHTCMYATQASNNNT